MLGIVSEQSWRDSRCLLSTKLGVGSELVAHLWLLYPPQLLAYLLNECPSPGPFRLKQCGLGGESNPYWAPTVCQALLALCVNVLS